MVVSSPYSLGFVFILTRGQNPCSRSHYHFTAFGFSQLLLMPSLPRQGIEKRVRFATVLSFSHLPLHIPNAASRHSFISRFPALSNRHQPFFSHFRIAESLAMAAPKFFPVIQLDYRLAISQFWCVFALSLSCSPTASISEQSDRLLAHPLPLFLPSSCPPPCA